MTALEQRIKEAAEKAIITGLASQGKRHLGVEYLSAHTALEDFWQLITPESIKALLAEKDAALESLTKQIADIRRAHLEEIRDLNRDARDAVAEARWEERQDEDYGSY